MEKYPLLDYDDIYAGLDDDILKNISINFFTMEDYFEFIDP
jgi:hypothetical protein